MAALESQANDAMVSAAPSSHRQRSNPFATAKEAAEVANEPCDPADFKLAAVHSSLPPVSTTTTPAAAAASSSRPPAAAKPRRKVTFGSMFSCPCVSPVVRASDAGDGKLAGPAQQQQQQHPGGASPAHQHHHWHGLSPRRSVRQLTALTQQGSMAYSDAEWFDSRSEFSSALSSAASNQAAKIEELSAMLREMYPPTHAHHGGAAAVPAGAVAAAAAAGSPRAGLTLAVSSGPHLPDPPLKFASPGVQFVPVPAVTGFAAYWERDPLRSTAYPSPIDQLTRCSSLAQRSHASIPGIWLQETDKQLRVIVKPRFLPSGLPCYTETYDKSNATCPHWNLRRDLRLGSTYGQIYFTACGMLILRARARPVFGSGYDYVTEEYIRLEQGGTVLVDRMCCMEVKTGNTATQYIVGHRHEVPPRVY